MTTSRQNVPDAEEEHNLFFSPFSALLSSLTFIFYPFFLLEKQKASPSLSFPAFCHQETPAKLDLCFSIWLLHMSTLMCFSRIVRINPIAVSSERKSRWEHGQLLLELDFRESGLIARLIMTNKLSCKLSKTIPNKAGCTGVVPGP